MMQHTTLYQFIIATLLLFSIFTSSTTNVIDNSSDLYYETLLDDNGENDDKEEEESEKKLFHFAQLISLAFYNVTQKVSFSHKMLSSFKHFTTPFRPPILS
jgi:nucleoside recognition membrane protein YjiH